MARVLVTGGAGFIGSHLVDALVHHGHRTMVMDDLSAGYRRNVHRSASFVHLDIRSSQVTTHIRRFRPDFVFHLAAQKNVRTSVTNPTLDADINVTGSLNIIEQSYRHKVKKIIFASSGAVYGDCRALPIKEDQPAKPNSPYGLAKYTVEQYLDFYQRQGRIQHTSLRFANVYGPRQDPKGEAGVVAIFAEQIRRRSTVNVNGTGRQTRDYIFVSDVVNALVRSMHRSTTGAINIGTGREASVLTLWTEMQRLAHRPIRIFRRPALAGEVRRSALDARRARRQLGWTPLVALAEGLQQTTESFWM